MATMMMVSLTHLNFSEAMIILDRNGSSGNSAIYDPNFVKLQSSESAWR